MGTRNYFTILLFYVDVRNTDVTAADTVIRRHAMTCKSIGAIKRVTALTGTILQPAGGATRTRTATNVTTGRTTLGLCACATRWRGRHPSTTPTPFLQSGRRMNRVTCSCAPELITSCTRIGSRVRMHRAIFTVR